MRRAALVAALVAVVAAAAQARKPKAPAPASGASYLDWIEVVDLDGQLTAAGRPVRAGYFAVAGTRLELSNDSRATFRLGKEGAVQGAFELKGPASFSVDGGRQPGLDLIRGRLLAALPKLKSPFHVHSRGLVAAVRGTDIYFDAGGRRDLYICVCSGSVEVSDNKSRGYRRTIAGEHHTGVGYRVGSGVGGSTLEADHAMEGHTDEDIDALIALTGDSR